MKQVNKYIVTNLGTEETSILNVDDRNLIKSYTTGIVSFLPEKHSLNLGIYNLNGDQIEVKRDIKTYTVPGDVQAGKVNVLNVDPLKDMEDGGYLGDIQIQYEAYNNLYSPNIQNDAQAFLYVTEISSDRTEIRAKSTNLSDNALKYYSNGVFNRLNNGGSTFPIIYLDFESEGIMVPCTNVITEVLQNSLVVTFKTYEALPSNIEEKDTFFVQEQIGEPVTFLIERQVEVIEDVLPKLKGPNFNVSLDKKTGNETDYFNYTELFSYPLSSSRTDLYSEYKKEGIKVSIDHSDFSQFIHFSSAVERLENFKEKLSIIKQYEKTLNDLRNTSPEDPTISQYEQLRTGILSNFDHYENYLYYESTDKSWPKYSKKRPYNNVDPAETEEGGTIHEWWKNILEEALAYDSQNKDNLVNTIPVAIREDPDNEPYLVFVYMIGQHFDEEWVYAKSLSDRYNGDNRLSFGISKDLVKEAIKSFGIDLCESDQNLEELFKQCNLDGTYNTGSEASVKYFSKITADSFIEDWTTTTHDGQFVVRDYPLENLNGEYAFSTGSVIGNVSGLTSTYLSGTLEGTVDADFDGQLRGIYEGSTYRGPFQGTKSGSISGSFEGTFRGTVDLNVDAFLSGSYFTGVKVNGKEAKNVGSLDQQPITRDDYIKEVYKRIYHNIPFLIKTKGTNRGLRALISCFGIPEDILEINVLGNRNVEERTYLGPLTGTTSSIERIRVHDSLQECVPLMYESGTFLENTQLVSQKSVTAETSSHSDSSHQLEVGFNLNKQFNDLVTKKLEESNIQFRYDNLIGDPRNTEENYGTTFREVLRLLVTEEGLDYSLLRAPSAIIRLVRYFDSMLFSSLEEFLSARAVTARGVIVEDHVLHRNRYKGVRPDGEYVPENYQGELQTGFITGSHGGVFDSTLGVGESILSRDGKPVTSSVQYKQPWSSGIGTGYKAIVDDSPKYNGEVGGSVSELLHETLINRNDFNGEIVDGNPYTRAGLSSMLYKVNLHFLDLPDPRGTIQCSITLTGNIVGTVYTVHTDLQGITAKYWNITGPYYDGKVNSTIILDGGDSNNTGESEEDGGIATDLSDVIPTTSGNVFSNSSADGFVILRRESSNTTKLNNQAILQLQSVPSKSNLRVLGWYAGNVPSNNKEPLYGSFLGSGSILSIVTGSTEDITLRSVVNSSPKRLAAVVTDTYVNVPNGDGLDEIVVEVSGKQSETSVKRYFKCNGSDKVYARLDNISNKTATIHSVGIFNSGTEVLERIAVPAVSKYVYNRNEILLEPNWSSV